MNTKTYALPKPTINQPHKEDRMQQVQNLAKAQRKISNNKWTRQRWEQRRQSQDTSLPQQIPEDNIGWLSYWGHGYPLLEDPNESTSKRARAVRRGDKIHKETNWILNHICGHLTWKKRASPTRR
jgi:hypothetical protein